METVHSDELQRAANHLFPRAEAKGFDALDDRDRTLFCVWLFCGEVDSGGFEQFFLGEAGGRTEETIRALERIGAGDAAELLREGIALFPSGRVPEDIDDRVDAIEDLPAAAGRAFADLGDRFQAIGSDEVMRQLADYYFRG